MPPAREMYTSARSSSPLDDAGTAVSAKAERTSIVVAHRLSTILHADEILVFHHGEIRERGGHRALLERRGLYERLYRLQLAAQDASLPSRAAEG